VDLTPRLARADSLKLPGKAVELDLERLAQEKM
jgi:hypothetical protein